MCEQNCNVNEEVEVQKNKQDYTTQLLNQIKTLENDLKNSNMNYERFNQLYISSFGTIYSAIQVEGSNIDILKDGLKRLLEIEAENCK
jgi:hypothetical protein